MTARYALYFSPENPSPWWTFGAQWLGRDEQKNIALQRPAHAGLPAAELGHITVEPRRYGFHATLKAPFRLADGLGEGDLLKSTHALARRLEPLALGPMSLKKLDDFMALIPDSVPPGLQSLAGSCVVELDGLRAPMSQAELQKRQPHKLDGRGRALLALYGYPHVLERFRFHMTLTGPVNTPEVALVTLALTPDICRLNAESPLVLDRLCIFREAMPGQPFLRIVDIPLGPP